jgi:probable HAF family extracellular repeat protein
MLRAMFLLTLAALGLFVGAMAAQASPIPQPTSTATIALRYTLTDCGTITAPGSTPPNPLNGGSIPTAINNKGEVVGQNGFASEEESHGFFYSGGKMHDVGSFYDYPSIAYGINDQSEVVGTVYGNDAPEVPGEEAFLYKDGQLINLQPLGLSEAAGINNSNQIAGFADNAEPNDYGCDIFRYVQGHLVFDATIQSKAAMTGDLTAFAINNRGQVVGRGYFANYDYIEHAFLYSDGRVQDLGALGVDTNVSYATALNDNGQVVGDVSSSLTEPSWVHAFLYSGGQTQDLGTLGGTYSYALGINSLGVVVGSSYHAGYGPNLSYDEESDPFNANARAFVYIAGHMYDLNTLLAANPVGWTLIEAVGINDFGQIAVTGLAPDGETIHALVLTPKVQGPALLK